MKHFFTLILALCCYCSHANDTLTVGEVYNFNVGDTFDYKYEVRATFNFGDTYYREIVSDKQVSINADTIIYTFIGPDGSVIRYDIVTGFETPVLFTADSSGPMCMRSHNYSPGLYLSLVNNEVRFMCSELTKNYKYGPGIGCVEQGLYTDGDYETKKLIYYAKGNNVAGIPYYVANGSTVINYKPLPEECATWTKVITVPNTGQEAIVEQIRTGSKVWVNGYNYVELIYRKHDLLSGMFTSDSALGYFYNDTANKSVLFAASTSASAELLYSFNGLNGAPCGPATVYEILQTPVGDSLATSWRCNTSAPFSGYNLISGVGTSGGLIKVAYYQMGQWRNYGSLTCFSVCGEVLYPTNDARYCDLLTSINEQFEEAAFNLYPNPANGQITFSNHGVVKYNNYTVYNMNGSVVTSGILDGDSQQISIANLVNGVYHFRAYAANGNGVSRRFIIGAQ